MPSLSRIADLIGKPLIVQSTPEAAKSFLQLGYEDDNYSDNGYYGHDDGTNDQCKGVGDAYVVITIRHASPRARAPVGIVSPANSSPPPNSQLGVPAGPSNQPTPTSPASKPFLETLPGIVAAVAALITALGTLIGVFLKSSKTSTSGQP
jgi:hypothetical protein